MYCTYCRTKSDKEAQFCKGCGVSIAASNQASQPVAPFAPPAPQPFVQESIYQPAKRGMPTWAIILISLGAVLFLLMCCAIAAVTAAVIFDDEQSGGRTTSSQQQQQQPGGLQGEISDEFSRGHHYDFAHVALPIEFYNDPQALLSELSGGDSPMLEEMWYRLAEESGLRAILPLPSDGLDYFMVHEGALTMAVVTMPPAEAIPEAIYVAMVYNSETGEASYYTLEKSFDDFTMFCAWHANRSRENFGEGTPAGDKAAFVDMVISFEADPADGMILLTPDP